MQVWMAGESGGSTMCRFVLHPPRASDLESQNPRVYPLVSLAKLDLPMESSRTNKQTQ